MRTPNLGTVFYSAGEPPSDPTQLPRYLQNEFQNIAAAIGALALGHLDKTTVAPAKPRDGDIRYASGAPDWNPGAGTGIYWFNGSVWTKL